MREQLLNTKYNYQCITSHTLTLSMAIGPRSWHSDAITANGVTLLSRNNHRTPATVANNTMTIRTIRYIQAMHVNNLYPVSNTRYNELLCVCINVPSDMHYVNTVTHTIYTVTRTI